MDKKEEYPEWRAKTVAIADSKGFGKTFMPPRQVIPTEERCEESSVTTLEKKVFKSNANGFSLLMLSTTKISFGLIQQA